MAILQLKNGHFQFEKWPFFVPLHAFFENKQAFSDSGQVFSISEMGIDCLALGSADFALLIIIFALTSLGLANT